MTKKRLAIPKEAVEDILLKSGRRCALCFRSGDGQLKTGSIAHVGSASEGEADTLDNLVFLCETHHAQLDRPKESKGISPPMLKAACEELYQAVGRGIFCGNCGELLTEPANTPVETRQPCPKCGSTRRNISVRVTESVTVSDSVTATVITYPKALLTIAQSLIDQGHFNIAIVTSHMACEIATERAFDVAYAAKKLEPLGEAVDGLMNGHNLGNERHRKLYNALTGNELEKQSFWPRFKNASDKRNSIVHKGGQANKIEAEAALQAAKDLITHLKQM
jgi:hypothetical protein